MEDVMDKPTTSPITTRKHANLDSLRARSCRKAAEKA